MGDFPKFDLTRPGGLYPHLADAPCAGCGREINPDDGCYASGSLIWHSTCWPRMDYAVERPMPPLEPQGEDGPRDG